MWIDPPLHRLHRIDLGDAELQPEQMAFAFSESPITSVPITTPVPEPETYVLMLAGLGLLGFVARRRKLREAAAA